MQTDADRIHPSVSHRVPVEADAARVHVEPVQDLRQRLVQPEYDLYLPVRELRNQGDSPEGPNRVDL